MQVLPVPRKGEQCRELPGCPSCGEEPVEEASTSGSFLKAQCVVLRSLFSLGGLLSRGDFSRRAVYLALKYTPGPSD